MSHCNSENIGPKPPDGENFALDAHLEQYGKFLEEGVGIPMKYLHTNKKGSFYLFSKNLPYCRYALGRNSFH